MCPLPDQDLLNIFFYLHPERLYELGCQWNYRSFEVSGGLKNDNDNDHDICRIDEYLNIFFFNS